MREKPWDIVRFRILDIGIQASFAFACLKDIPQCHVVLPEQIQAFRIWEQIVELEQIAHDFPESVVPEGVILPHPQ